MSLLSDGQRIGDSYQVERFLGQGAYAEVYRVRHEYFGKQAMKVFKHIGTLEQTQTMLAEPVLLSRIDHPNIIRVYNAGTVDTPGGTCGYFTMTYVAGGSLESFWVSHRDRFVPVDDTVHILGQACAGLSVAHSDDPPIIHRDLTPQNILVGYDKDGLRVRISDFGLAKRVDAMGFGSTKGTLAFKAPEALRNRYADSRASDVWALGTIAYLLLTDTLPYDGSTDPEYIFGAQFQVPPASPRERNPLVDEELARIVLAALDPDPSSRIQDAMELGRAFDEWRARRARQRLTKADVQLPYETTKSVLGEHTGSDEAAARRLATEALEKARQARTLPDAADLMEEAFNKSRRVRAEYEARLRLWRKGVVG